MNKSLLEVCNITTGNLDSNAATENGKYPFFTCAPTPLRIDNYEFDDDVILLAGNNAQGNFHINRYKGKFNAYQRTYIITAHKDFNIDYIKYSIEMALNHFKKISQGSQTKFLTMTILEQFQVKNIPLEQQKQRVACLVALDEKISINKKINATLEDMAKTLYDYWFVQFDFPDDNGKPYKSSGGKMIFNQEIGREIPIGWEVVKLSNLVKISPETEIPTDNPKKIYEYYSIPAYDEKKFPTFEFGSDIGSSKYIVNDNVILYSKLNPSFKRIWKPFNITEKCICSTEFIVFEPFDSKNYSFIYATLNNDSFKNYMINLSTSSTGSRSRVQPKTCLSYLIILPSKKIIYEFENIYSPILKKINLLIEENDSLENLQDFLLPLLMNGQVGFKE